MASPWDYEWTRADVAAYRQMEADLTTEEAASLDALTAAGAVGVMDVTVEPIGRGTEPEGPEAG